MRYRPAILAAALLMTWGQSGAETRRQMVVTVVNEHFTPRQPVESVQVSVSYFDGSEKVTDAQKRTNRQGQTELDISRDAQAQAEVRGLRVEVSDAEGLVVYQPAEGKLDGVPPTLTVVLLPKGSAALLEPSQIEAMLDRLSRLSAQNQQLRMSLNKVESQKPDFDLALREWATRNGLPYNEVNEKVRTWANDVLAHKEQASLVKQAEAELGLRHFERAAILFQGAANSSNAALDKEQEDYLLERRKELRELLEHAEQSAEAFQLADQFPNATQVMDGACKRAADEHQHYPEDAKLKSIWLWGSLGGEGVRQQEGDRALTAGGSAKNAGELFKAVAGNLKSLLNQMDKSSEGHAWVMAQLMLAVTYASESEIEPEGLGSKPPTDSREQMIAATRAALEVCDKEKDPKMWTYAQTMYALGLGFKVGRGIMDGRLTREEAEDFLGQAINAIQAALQGCSKTETPSVCGRLHSMIGEFLLLQSSLADGVHKRELLEHAELANKAALEVTSRIGDAESWSAEERELATIFAERAVTTSGSEAETYFAEANATYRAALEVCDKKERPLDWADTQDALARVLQVEGIRGKGDRAVEFLEQAAGALRGELEVITKAAFPQRWAQTENSLGNVLAEQGERMPSSKVGEVLQQAAAAYQSALEVLTKEENSSQWAQTQLMLGTVLASQVPLVGRAKSDELLAEATAAFRAALEVFNAEKDAKQWAMSQSSLGNLLLLEGQRADGAQANGLFRQAAAAFEAALKVMPGNVSVLAALSGIYHDYLTDFDKAYALAEQAERADPSDTNRLSLAEAALTASKFAECVEAASATNEAQLRSNLPARSVLLFACEWGAGQKASAARTANSLAEYSSGTPKGDWVTQGDRKYLETAPEFKAGRALWITLFQSLENNDGPALAEAARNLQALMGK